MRRAVGGTLALALSLAAMAALAAVSHGQSGGTVSPTIAPTPTPAPGSTPGGPTQVFPVPAPHTFGDGFGAGRGHQGVDIF